MSTVRRFDRVALKADDKRTPQGFLRVDARIARTGIQLYRNADGTTRREYRPPAEVFNADALASFSLLPLTLNHPPEAVTAENVGIYEVGTIGETVKQDGKFVATTVVVKKADAIKAVLAGTQELSCGYECDLDFTPGEADGQKYDAIQRNVRGNHVAIVPQGRAGPEVRMKLDSTDAVAVDDLAAPNQEAPTMTKIKVDGVDCEVSETVAALFKREQTKADETTKALATATKEVETQKARADVAEAAKVSADKARTDAEAPARIEALVAERVALIATATKAIGQDFKADGKTPVAIKREVLAKTAPGLKLDGKSDDYVSAAFESATAMLAERNPAEAARTAAGTETAPATQNDAAEFDETAAREKMKAANRNAWKSDAQLKAEAAAAAAAE